MPRQFDRWYRRLHPIRHSLARRLDRIEREQREFSEIASIRELTRDRQQRGMHAAGTEDMLENARHSQDYNISDRLRARRRRHAEAIMDRLQDEDPLNQFNRRLRRRFEEAMTRETNDLASRLQRLHIFDPPQVHRAPLQTRSDTEFVEEVD